MLGEQSDGGGSLNFSTTKKSGVGIWGHSVQRTIGQQFCVDFPRFYLIGACKAWYGWIEKKK